MTDPERIWLQNADDARATGDRLWCQDKVWPECDEQQEPTEYIRADLYASRISQQDAELERLRREVEVTKAVIAWANNSLFGSHGFFLSLDGGEPDEHHLDWAIEDLKARGLARQAQLAKALRLIRWAHDTLYEINPSNYDHDEVCKLNDASVEVILGLAVELGEKHGKSDEWWENHHSARKGQGGN